MAKWSNLEIDNFTTLRRKWKCSILKIVSFTKLKTEKVKKKIVKIEKYIFKTKACDSFSLALMERAPQNYPQNVLTQNRQKIRAVCTQSESTKSVQRYRVLNPKMY